MNAKKLGLFVTLVLLTFNLWAAEIAMVTSLNGTVIFSGGTAIGTSLRTFVKLRAGDQLLLKEDTRLQIVFFGSGRHEAWRGAGRLDVGSVACTPVNGGLKAEVKTLPAILVKQLSKTPVAEDVGRTAMVRLRSLHTDGAIDAIDKAYAEFREQASANDHSPELYLLASYFELREYGKVTEKLKELEVQYPQDAEIAKLKALYLSAIARANDAARQPAGN